MIFGQFGALIFARQVGLMHDFEASQSEVYVEHPIHLFKPTLEHVGPGLASASFAMDFLEEFTSAPATVITLLTEIKAAARAYPLIVGGRPIAGFQARFVLVEFSEAHHWYNDRGGIQNATVKASFLEYAARPQI